MKRWLLVLLLCASAWAGPTYSKVATIPGVNGTAEFWEVKDSNLHVAALKVKETGKEGEVNVVLGVPEFTRLNKEIDVLMKDRTPLKAGMVHVTGSLRLAHQGSIDLATVRPSGTVMRVLVVKEEKNERMFVLDNQNLAKFKRAVENSQKLLR